MINEELAKRAKEAISFSDYKQGTATNNHNYYVNEFKANIERIVTTRHIILTEELQEFIDYYTNKYITKLADAINKENEITTRCPSIMICGAGNFPTRRKEKQNEASRSHWEKTGDLYEPTNNWISRKIIAHITNKIIYSDDKNAVEKIKNKIAQLELQPDQFGNKKANIRRLKERLLVLSPEEMIKDKKVTINGIDATYENIIKIFDDAPARKSMYGGDEYYLDIQLIFKDEKRKYNQYLSIEVSEDKIYHMTIETTNYTRVSKKLTDIDKFNLIISQISGSGNKAVIYKALRELLPKPTTAEIEKDNNAEKTINGESIEVIENSEVVRLQLIFEGKPEEETRTILKSNGFRWSPRYGAWQRLLNNNAKHALNRMVK